MLILKGEYAGVLAEVDVRYVREGRDGAPLDHPAWPSIVDPRAVEK